MGPKGTHERLQYLGKEASVCQAEILAITMSATEIASQEWSDRKITILTDSQAAIRALAREWTNSRLIKDCKEKLNKLGTRNMVEIMWVPGHSGVAGNERVDELARTAAKDVTPGQIPRVSRS